MTNEVTCPQCKQVFEMDAAGYAEITKQIRGAEFEHELHQRLEQQQETHQLEIELAESKVKQESATESGNKDKQIDRLKAELKASDTTKKLAVREALDPLKEELVKLRGDVSSADSEKALLEKSLQEKHQIELQNKDAIIVIKQEEIDRVKDMKLKMSVKEIGESLEKWCEDQFNILRPSAFPNAYFEKDNESVKEGDDVKGSKGDYIFREADSNGVEFVSIMFEMKDKMEGKKGETNESHLKKLDADRRKKNCEYAVLVSMLEPESELYNQGIVNMSHNYENMYVVRPQSFLTILGIIRNEARKSLEVRNELTVIRNQNLDIENFEDSLEEFKGDLSQRVGWAQDRYTDSIKDVDKAIANLEKLRINLIKSSDHLELAEKKAKSTTVKSLTRGNPTMAAKFAAVKKKKDEEE